MEGGCGQRDYDAADLGVDGGVGADDADADDATHLQLDRV